MTKLLTTKPIRIVFEQIYHPACLRM